MIKLRTQAIYDAGSVQRCHTLRTIQKDTVGSHSYRVAYLCLELAEGRIPTHRMLELIKAALLHDAAEAYTGDICAPAKKVLVGNLENVEKEYLKSVGIVVPYLTPVEEWILKAADTLDLLMFSREEMRMGNSGIRPVFSKCEEWLSEMLVSIPEILSPESISKIKEIMNER